MTDKLEKLTKQIYEEGVVKAKEEARKIIDSAQEEKKRILRSARQEAEDIATLARREAEELKKRVESELRMATQQSLVLLRQKITELICVSVAEDSSQELFDDPKFLKRMIEIVMETWIASGCQERELYLKLPAAIQKDIQEYFFEKGKRQLDKGLQVEFDETLKRGFTISPKDGSYRIGFTEEDFRALIQHFLRPRMKTFLFEKKSDETP